jgi:TolB-like protein/Tfp pilus assembly protein PilF
MTASAAAPPHRRTHTAARALLLGACCAYATVPAWAQCPDGTPPPCASASRAPRPAAPSANSVAVLYFDNLSRDSTDAYVADGLTEEIIARLTQVSRLTVKSRTAVQRLRGTAHDPAALGRQLAVAHLVSGSVRHAGNRLRVSVELTRASTGVGEWAEQYDRTDADLLGIQEDIARAVATAITGRLLPEERATLAARPTGNPAAYDHYLRGQHLVAQRSPRSITAAITEFEAALRLDPAFAGAMSRLAYAYGLFYDWGWRHETLPRESLLTRAIDYADRALRLDSVNTEAWRMRGYLRSHLDPYAFSGAREALDHAVRLDPRNVDALLNLAWMLVKLGDDSAAAPVYRQALALEPTRAISLEHLARMSHRARRWAEERRWLDSAVAVDAGFYRAYADRSLVRLQQGDAEGARSDAEAAIRLGAGDTFRGPAALALVRVRQGDTSAARQSVERMLAGRASPDYVTVDEGLWIGMTLVALGERDRVLDLLEQVRPRGAELWHHLQWPELDAIRADPRFQRVYQDARPVGARSP